MVFGFMIQWVEEGGGGGTSSEGSGSIPLICLSQFYTPEGNDHLREKRRDTIASHIALDISARQSFAKALPSSDLAKKDKVDEGAFKVPKSDWFAQPKVVVWCQCLSFAISLICEIDENRYLALNFLSSFSRIMKQTLKQNLPIIGPKELLVKYDEVLIALQTYLPNGQLLFTSEQLTKHLKKETDSTFT